MDRTSRVLLRRIAKGLPFVAAPFGGLLISGFSICGPCPGPPEAVVTHHPITLAEHESLVNSSGTIDMAACERLCASLRSDGGVSDAGISSGFGTQVTCSLDRVEPDEILTCTSQDQAPGCIGGRRPQSFVHEAPARRDAGAWLAEVAQLEAASVPAFEELADELALHGAPGRFSRAARAAADDERRHTIITTALAARFGAWPSPVRRGETRARTLLELAEDNAVEGCAREAFGALVAAHQAVHASDPVVRAAFHAIARDEARHALLSFAIHDWACARLGADEARRIDARRRATIAALVDSMTDPTPLERDVLGLPDAARAAALVSSLA